MSSLTLSSLAHIAPLHTGKIIIPVQQTIAKDDLPEGSRVIEPNTMITMDFRPER
jgi:hypothetical protein